MMKRIVKQISSFIFIGISLLFITSCSNRKSSNDAGVGDVDSVAVMDSMRPDMPPPPPDGMHPDGPPPPPPHGKGRPPHKPDNMRGFDPASEDDMEDNGMSRYMENDDEEGWD